MRCLGTVLANVGLQVLREHAWVAAESGVDYCPGTNVFFHGRVSLLEKSVSGSETLGDVELMRNRKLVLGANTASWTKGSVYLRRPQGDYARVISQNSNFENVITAARWEGAFGGSLSVHLLPSVRSYRPLFFFRCYHFLQKSKTPTQPIASFGSLTIDIQHPFWRVRKHQRRWNECIASEGFSKCRGYSIYPADVFELN